jgi:hypothetical protein
MVGRIQIKSKIVLYPYYTVVYLNLYKVLFNIESILYSGTGPRPIALVDQLHWYILPQLPHSKFKMTPSFLFAFICNELRLPQW